MLTQPQPLIRARRAQGVRRPIQTSRRGPLHGERAPKNLGIPLGIGKLKHVSLVILSLSTRSFKQISNIQNLIKKTNIFYMLLFLKICFAYPDYDYLQHVEMSFASPLLEFRLSVFLIAATCTRRRGSVRVKAVKFLLLLSWHSSSPPPATGEVICNYYSTPHRTTHCCTFNNPLYSYTYTLIL